MLNLLATLLVIVIVLGLAFWAVRLLPLPAPASQIANVLLVLIALVLVLGLLFGGVPLLHVRSF